MTRMRSWLIAAATAALTLGAAAQLERGQKVGGFRVPEYDENGQLKSQLYGDYAQVITEDKVKVTNLKIEMFKNGEVETRVTAPHCIYNRRSNTAASPGSIRIARGNMVITGSTFMWSATNQVFVIETNARVVFRDVRRQMKSGAFPLALPAGGAK